MKKYYIEFKKWLEDTGAVSHRNLNNIEAGGGFETIRSKYMTGQKKEPPSTFDPDKKFGIKKKNKKCK